MIRCLLRFKFRFKLLFRQNETLTDLCKSCFKECASVWYDVKDLQSWLNNYKCRRGVSYPYSCIFMVKQFIYEKDDVTNLNEEYETFVQYMNDYSVKFWNNYQIYMQQLMQPISLEPYGSFTFTTPIPWNLPFM